MWLLVMRCRNCGRCVVTVVWSLCHDCGRCVITVVWSLCHDCGCCVVTVIAVSGLWSLCPEWSLCPDCDRCVVTVVTVSGLWLLWRDCGHCVCYRQYRGERGRRPGSGSGRNVTTTESSQLSGPFAGSLYRLIVLAHCTGSLYRLTCQWI